MASDAWVEWIEEAELVLDALMVDELRSALLSLAGVALLLGVLSDAPGLG